MGVDKVRLMVPFDPEFEGLKNYHLTELKSAGDRMLPPMRGVATRRNIEGRIIIHKDQPKEPRSWSIIWGRNQFCGGGKTEWVEDYVIRTQMCFPRSTIPAEGVELCLIAGQDGMRIGTDEIALDNEERLLVAINIMLEVFGMCWIIDSAHASATLAPVRRLNWRLLPAGNSRWEGLKEHVKEVVKKGTAREASLRNLEGFYRAGANEVVVGQGGFEHYVGFVYHEAKLVILESVMPNNATYVFGDDWETLTKLSKGELIEGGLHQARVIHDKYWAANIKRWLNKDVA